MSSNIGRLSTGTTEINLSDLFTPEEERILRRDDRMSFIFGDYYQPKDPEAKELFPHRDGLRIKFDSASKVPMPKGHPSIQALSERDWRQINRSEQRPQNYSLGELGQREKEAFEKLLFYFGKNIRFKNPKIRQAFGLIVRFSQKAKNRAEEEPFSADDLVTDITEVVIKRGLGLSLVAASGPAAPLTAIALTASELSNILRGLIRPHLEAIIEGNELVRGKQSFHYSDLWPAMKLGSTELVQATFDLLAAPDQLLTDAAHIAVRKGKEELNDASKKVDSLCQKLGSLSINDPVAQEKVEELTRKFDSLTMNESIQEQVTQLEHQEQKIRGMIKDLEQDIKSHESADRTKFWAAVGMAAGNAMVEAATDYITTQHQIDAVASHVKYFVKQFEQQKARLNEHIQTDNREEVRGELISFFQKIQNPQAIAKSYEELKKSGQKLSSAIAELKETRAALLAEAKEGRNALVVCGEKEKKYKRALAKAIRSGKRAGKSAGIFSGILKVAGAVLCAIPGPTQIAGAALLSSTHAAGAFVDHNRNRILDSRVNKHQNRLSLSLEERRGIINRLDEISTAVSEIDRTQQGIDAWIMDPASRSALLVDDRLKEQQRVVLQNEQDVGNIKGKICSKQVEIETKTAEWHEREAKLNEYRAISDLEHKHKKKWKEYHALLAVQAGCNDELGRLDKELQDLKDKDLPYAEGQLNQNSQIFKEEEGARFVVAAGQRIDQMMARDAAKVSLKERSVAENMKKFEALQNGRSVASSTMIDVGGELALALYSSTGTTVPYHVYCMAFHAYKVSAMIDRLQEADKQWMAFFTNPDGSIRDGSRCEFGQENYINCFIAPTVRALASSFAVLHAAYLLCQAGAYTFGLWQPRVVKSDMQLLYEALQSEMGRCTSQVGRWMSDMHQDLSRQNRALYENINRMRSELGVLGKELFSRLQDDKNELLGELEQDRFTIHCQEVQKQITKLQQMGIEFRNYPNRDEKEWLSYLGKIKGMILLCCDPRMNGYTLLLRDDEFIPSVGLDRLYHNPDFFTGLLARHLEKNGHFPNAALLMVIESEFGQLAFPSSPGEVLRQGIKEINATIIRLQKQLGTLSHDIPSLIQKLHIKQKLLFNKLRESQEKWQARKEQMQLSFRRAMESFKDFGKASFLGSGRFFLHSEVAAKPFDGLLPKFNYEYISNRSEYGNSLSSHLLTAGVQYTAAMGLLVCSPWLVAAPALGMGRKLLYLQSIFQYEDIIKPSLRVKNVSNLLTEKVDDSSGSSYAEKKSLGVDLKTRKVAVLTDKDSKLLPFVNLAMSMQVYWLIPYRKDPILHLKVELADTSPVTLDELKHIAQFSDSVYDSSPWIQKLAEEYSQVLQAHVDGRQCETEFAKRLGGYQFLVSRDNRTIPLAFPDSLMEELESQISMEIAYAEKCDIGMLIPHYEFSLEKGTLSIVYSFVDEKESKPYCQFIVGYFDAVTLATFEKDICDSEGRIDSQLKDPNEFLLQMMYCGLMDGEPMPAMPGDKTLRLASGLVAPADRPFVGLYKIVQKAPTKALYFNCRGYTRENQSAIDDWIGNRKEIYPESLIRTAGAPKFSPDFLETWQKIFEGKKQMGSDSSYQNTYYLLLSLLKLSSRHKSQQLVDALAGMFSIYSPAMRDVMLDRDERMDQQVIDEETIEDFLDKLKSTQEI